MKRLLAAALAFTMAANVHASGWQETKWQGEHAFASETGKLRAIVSVERGRLVYFGAAGGTHNLLFTTATKDAPVGWGGHRIWLGPQSEWGWPPPAAWEASAAEQAVIRGEALELILPDAGHGWSRLTRVYFWRDGALHCDARISGGTRPAQIIQIFQTPTATVPKLHAKPTERAALGYVQVHGGRVPSPRFVFPVPPHVTTAGDAITLKFVNETEKLGFEPQPIEATLGDVRWHVLRGASAGRAATMPDEGYATQIYLGSGKDELIELEQLSPLYTAGTDAHFEVVLRVE